MKPIEREMIHGMTNLLNDAIEAYNLGKPIISDEQFDMRINDLKELEKETGYMLTCSPNEEGELEESVVRLSVNMDECNNVDRLVEFSNGKKLVANAVPKGVNICLRYVNGNLIKMETEEAYYFKLFKNMPSKIGEKVNCVVKGKAVPADDRKLYFYVTDMIDNNNDGVCDSLQKAEVLGFDVVPYWNAAELNPKKIQSFIDFAYDYVEDNDMPCEGIAFRFDNIDNKPLRYRGIIYKKD